MEVFDSMDAQKVVWKHSRPHLDDNDPELFTYEDNDLPVRGFNVFAVTFYCTTAFRDLLYMIRPQVGAWAQSNRTFDLQRDNLFFSNEVQEHQKQGVIDSMELFLKLKSEGVTQDEAKKKLNQSHLVYADLMIDLRTLANLVYALKQLSGVIPFYETYGKPLEEQVPAIVGYPGRRVDLIAGLEFNASDEYALNNYNPMNRFQVLGGRVASVLHSQLIRKMYDKVKSSSIKFLRDGSIYDYDQSLEYDTVVYIEQDSMDFTVSTRSCWFAKFDKEDSASWSGLIANAVEDKDIKESVPCKGCADKCPFRTEQLARFIGGNKVDYTSVGEVNPPCPILSGSDVPFLLRDFIHKPDSRVWKVWFDSDFSKFRTTKDGFQYYYNIMKYGYADEYSQIPENRKKLDHLVFPSIVIDTWTRLAEIDFGLVSEVEEILSFYNLAKDYGSEGSGFDFELIRKNLLEDQDFREKLCITLKHIIHNY